MSDPGARLYSALGVPATAQVDRRVAKSALVERGGLSSADKKVMDAGVERLTWRSTLTPQSVALRPLVDETRDYSQIVVMSAVLRPGATVDRLSELIHRAIAHPLTLIVQGHGQGAQDVDLSRRIGRAQPARPHQFAQNHPGQGCGQDRIFPRLQPRAQPGRRSLQRGHQKGDARIAADQHLDLVRGHHAHDGGQAAALVQGRAQNLRQPGPHAQKLAQDLFDRDHDHGPGRPRRRGPVGQVHQPFQTRARALRPHQGPGDDPAHDEGPVRNAGQPFGHIGQRAMGQVGKGVPAPGRHDPFHRLFGQFLIVTDQFVRGLAGVLALGNGDLLDRVLDLDAGRLQQFDQVRPVQQLKGGDAIAHQPILQHPADQVARMGRIEVVRSDAVGAFVVRGNQPLPGRLGRASGQDGDAVELHGLAIQGFLGHPDGHRLFLAQDFLGRVDGVLALFGRQHQRPGGRSRLADIDFVVDGTGHALAFLRSGPGSWIKGFKVRFHEPKSGVPSFAAVRSP